MQGSYNCEQCQVGYYRDGRSNRCESTEGFCNGQRCDRNAECEDHGYGESSCTCMTGWAGNGIICGPDTDLDKYPDSQLPCTDRFCKQVSRNGYMFLVRLHFVWFTAICFNDLANLFKVELLVG